MPSERFYRLPEVKRKLICEAAIKEFARVTIDKVSINQIIKNAGISRGSFYTYFEDKWDILAYVFEDSHQKYIDMMKKSLKDKSGNIWFVMEDIMDTMLQFCSNRSNFKFLQNVVPHINSDDVIRGFSKKGKEYSKMSDCIEKWVFENIDTDQLNLDGFETFRCLFGLGMSAVIMSIREFYEGATKEEAKRMFQTRLGLLKNGAVKSGGS